MNFLELCQRAVMEGGASGNNSTVVGAAGEWARFVTWVNQAWKDVQFNRNDWLWMRKTKSFSTIANQGEYPIASAPLSLTDFGNWVEHSFRIYQTSAGIGHELTLDYVPYEYFRDTWLISSLRYSYTQPTRITVSPSKSLILALPPDSTDYTISGDYYKTLTALTLDTDTPDMPVRFHEAIVWKALMYYGAYESAPEKYTSAEREFKRIMTQLEIDQLPDIIVRR